jgi:outer membrane protein assembly factor BamB
VIVDPGFKNLKIDTNFTSLKLSDIATSVSYIPLETSAQNMIGAIEKIDYYSKMFFVLDKKMSKSLSVFDNKGKLLYQKKAKDGGLKKVTSISDFSIDRLRNVLYIYSKDNTQVLAFDVYTGNYIRSFKVADNFKHFTVLNSGSFLFLRDGLKKYKDKVGDYRVFLLDSAGKVVKKWIDNPMNQFVSGGDIVCSRAEGGGKVWISRMLNDTIYTFSNSQLSASCKIDVGRKAVPDEMLNTENQKRFVSLIDDPQTEYIVRGFFDTKKTFAFFLKQDETVGLSWHDKNKNRNFLIRYIENDLDNTSVPLMNYMDDTCFVSAIQASVLQQQYSYVLDEPGFKSKYKNLIELNGLVTQDSNPVIILVSLK